MNLFYVPISSTDMINRYIATQGLVLRTCEAFLLENDLEIASNVL